MRQDPKAQTMKNESVSRFARTLSAAYSPNAAATWG